MSVNFDRGSPGKFDSRTLIRGKLSRGGLGVTRVRQAFNETPEPTLHDDSTRYETEQTAKLVGVFEARLLCKLCKFCRGW